MTAPISFPSTTSNFAFPLLFAGQAQKELSINHALTLIDSMLTPSVSASLSTPPAGANEGDCFRISASPTDDWSGHEGEIAIQIGGAWQFIYPKSGMTVFDKAAGSLLHYNSGWKNAAEPAPPTGGNVVDNEARAALSDLIQALRNLGVFSNPS